mmetsp:Transcript_24389/g.60927  ORF Transcript_24389/g.60927 Transcript_24389/m.60927 type:complete len:205 (-) Transcript_24389:4358-4972(-)
MVAAVLHCTPKAILRASSTSIVRPKLLQRPQLICKTPRHRSLQEGRARSQRMPPRKPWQPCLHFCTGSCRASRMLRLGWRKSFLKDKLSEFRAARFTPSPTSSVCFMTSFLLIAASKRHIAGSASSWPELLVRTSSYAPERYHHIAKTITRAAMAKGGIGIKGGAAASEITFSINDRRRLATSAEQRTCASGSSRAKQASRVLR